LFSIIPFRALSNLWGSQTGKHGFTNEYYWKYISVSIINSNENINGDGRDVERGD
jgi:hypothetical protein